MKKNHFPSFKDENSIINNKIIKSSKFSYTIYNN